MTKTDYFAECIAICAEEENISLTPEQINLLAGAVEGSVENMGQAFYVPCESPYKRELDDAKAALKKEREKIDCPLCRGRGRLIDNGPVHSSDSQCWKCGGAGRINP